MHSYLWCGFIKLLLNKCIALPFRWYNRPVLVKTVTNLQFACKVVWSVGGWVCRLSVGLAVGSRPIGWLFGCLVKISVT
jgi:hypothetical protein